MPDLSETPHPKVFISYSQDDDTHRKRMLGLAERLRTDGFETMADRCGAAILEERARVPSGRGGLRRAQDTGE